MRRGRCTAPLCTGLLAVVMLSVACAPASGDAPLATLRVQVLATVPHDRSAFTEGLELAGGVLYEGTGREGASELREVNPATGAVGRAVPLAADEFGEGIAVVGPRIWQLTWRNGVAIERDRSTLAELRRVGYSGEGWGLCFDGTRLVASDGSDRLTFRDPASFDALGSVAVRRGGAPVDRLNELECTGGAVWANVFTTDQLVRIDPASGQVTATVDVGGLLPDADRAGADVLNGIAAVPGTDEFLLTGKLWPSMFRVRFVPL